MPVFMTRCVAHTLLLACASLPALASKCGKLKWDIKTGSDLSVTEATEILNDQKPSTISALVAVPKPPNSKIRHNEQGTLERKLLVVSASLLEYKREPDGDYHLVLQDGRHVLVAEIPDPVCAPKSPLLKNIALARAEFENQSHGLKPTSGFKLIEGGLAVTVKGIGFFDKPHGTTGAAANDLEIHPVTEIAFSDEARPSSTSIALEDSEDQPEEEASAENQEVQTAVTSKTLEQLGLLILGLTCILITWDIVRPRTVEKNLQISQLQYPSFGLIFLFLVFALGISVLLFYVVVVASQWLRN